MFVSFFCCCSQLFDVEIFNFFFFLFVVYLLLYLLLIRKVLTSILYQPDSYCEDQVIELELCQNITVYDVTTNSFKVDFIFPTGISFTTQARIFVYHENKIIFTKLVNRATSIFVVDKLTTDTLYSFFISSETDSAIVASSKFVQLKTLPALEVNPCFSHSKVTWQLQRDRITTGQDMVWEEGFDRYGSGSGSGSGNRNTDAVRVTLVGKNRSLTINNRNTTVGTLEMVHLLGDRSNGRHMLIIADNASLYLTSKLSECFVPTTKLPKDLTAHNTTWNSVVLTWVAPNWPSGTIVAYIVRVYRGIPSEATFFFSVRVETSRAAINGLEGETLLVFTVTAESAVVSSKESDGILVALSKKPLPAPYICDGNNSVTRWMGTDSVISEYRDGFTVLPGIKDNILIDAKGNTSILIDQENVSVGSMQLFASSDLLSKFMVKQHLVIAPSKRLTITASFTKNHEVDIDECFRNKQYWSPQNINYSLWEYTAPIRDQNYNIVVQEYYTTTLSWSSPLIAWQPTSTSNSGNGVYEYEIYMSQNGVETIIVLDGTINTFTPTKLMPTEIYSFKIRANSQHARGIWSTSMTLTVPEKIQVCGTKLTFQGGIPQISQVRSKRIQINFDNPLNWLDGISPTMTESVVVLPSVQGIEQMSVVFQKITAVSQLIAGSNAPTQLLDLVVPVGSRLDITNKHECLFAVPSTPTQPSISEMTQSSVTLTWDLSATRGGNVDSYVVTSNKIIQETIETGELNVVSIVERFVPVKEWYIDVSELTTTLINSTQITMATYTVTDLLPYQSYAFTISAKYQNSIGRPSATSIIVRTKKGQPPKPGVPTKISTSTSGNKMTLQWTVPASSGGPPIETFSGELKSALVTYTVQQQTCLQNSTTRSCSCPDDGWSIPVAVPKYLNSEYSSTSSLYEPISAEIIKNLDVSGYYRFRVQASNLLCSFDVCSPQTGGEINDGDFSEWSSLMDVPGVCKNIVSPTLNGGGGIISKAAASIHAAAFDAASFAVRVALAHGAAPTKIGLSAKQAAMNAGVDEETAIKIAGGIACDHVATQYIEQGKSSIATSIVTMETALGCGLEGQTATTQVSESVQRAIKKEAERRAKLAAKTALSNGLSASDIGKAAADAALASGASSSEAAQIGARAAGQVVATAAVSIGKSSSEAQADALAAANGAGLTGDEAEIEASGSEQIVIIASSTEAAEIAARKAVTTGKSPTEIGELSFTAARDAGATEEQAKNIAAKVASKIVAEEAVRQGKSATDANSESLEAVRGSGLTGNAAASVAISSGSMAVTERAKREAETTAQALVANNATPEEIGAAATQSALDTGVLQEEATSIGATAASRVVAKQAISSGKNLEETTLAVERAVTGAGVDGAEANAIISSSSGSALSASATDSAEIAARQAFAKGMSSFEIGRTAFLAANSTHGITESEASFISSYAIAKLIAENQMTAGTKTNAEIKLEIIQGIKGAGLEGEFATDLSDNEVTEARQNHIVSETKRATELAIGNGDSAFSVGRKAKDAALLAGAETTEAIEIGAKTASDSLYMNAIASGKTDAQAKTIAQEAITGAGMFESSQINTLLDTSVSNAVAYNLSTSIYTAVDQSIEMGTNFDDSVEKGISAAIASGSTAAISKEMVISYATIEWTKKLASSKAQTAVQDAISSDASLDEIGKASTIAVSLSTSQLSAFDVTIVGAKSAAIIIAQNGIAAENTDAQILTQVLAVCKGAGVTGVTAQNLANEIIAQARAKAEADAIAADVETETFPPDLVTALTATSKKANNFVLKWQNPISNGGLYIHKYIFSSCECVGGIECEAVENCWFKSLTRTENSETRTMCDISCNTGACDTETETSCETGMISECNANSLTLSGMKRSTLFSMKIKACNAKGCSTFSDDWQGEVELNPNPDMILSQTALFLTEGNIQKLKYLIEIDGPSRPTEATVAITIVESTSGQGGKSNDIELSTTQVTLSAANEYLAMVEVGIVDDMEAEHVEKIQLLHTLSSIDPMYNEITRNIALTLNDNDTPGAVFEIDILSLPVVTGTVLEGQDSNYKFKLLSQPTKPVNVQFNVVMKSQSNLLSEIPKLTVTPTTLSFDDTNWSAAQQITFHAEENYWNLPGSTFLIQPYISSEDTFYDSDGNAWQDKKGMKTIAIMDVTNNDLAGFKIDQHDITMEEKKDTKRTTKWGIKLTSKPIDSNVVISIVLQNSANAANAREAPTISPTSLIFSSANWDIEQQVTSTVRYLPGEYENTVFIFDHILSSLDTTFSSVVGVTQSVVVTVVDIDKSGAVKLITTTFKKPDTIDSLTFQKLTKESVELLCYKYQVRQNNIILSTGNVNNARGRSRFLNSNCLPIIGWQGEKYCRICATYTEKCGMPYAESNIEYTERCKIGNANDGDDTGDGYCLGLFNANANDNTNDNTNNANDANDEKFFNVEVAMSSITDAEQCAKTLNNETMVNQAFQDSSLSIIDVSNIYQQSGASSVDMPAKPIRIVNTMTELVSSFLGEIRIRWEFGTQSIREFVVELSSDKNNIFKTIKTDSTETDNTLILITDASLIGQTIWARVRAVNMYGVSGNVGAWSRDPLHVIDQAKPPTLITLTRSTHDFSVVEIEWNTVERLSVSLENIQQFQLAWITFHASNAKLDVDEMDVNVPGNNVTLQTGVLLPTTLTDQTNQIDQIGQGRAFIYRFKGFTVAPYQFRMRSSNPRGWSKWSKVSAPVYESCRFDEYLTTQRTLTECDSCPEGATCNGKTYEDILPHAGYWRLPWTEEIPLFAKCRFGNESCLVVQNRNINTSTSAANYTNETTTCGVKYNGIACDVCATGYAYDRTIRDCTSCQGSSGSAGIFVSVLFFSFVGLLITTLIMLRAAAADSNEKHHASMYRCATLVKPLMTVVHITAVVPLLPLQWPPALLTFCAGFSIIGTSAANIFDIGCHLQRNVKAPPIAIQKLLMAVYAPLIGIVWSALVALLTGLCFDKKTKKNKKLGCLSRFVTALLLTLLHCCPMATVQIFDMFVCRKLNENDFVEVLATDATFQCHTNEYKQWMASVVTPMMLVFVVGIPLGFFLVLWGNRTTLHKPGASIKSKFFVLHIGLTSNRWWWDVVISPIRKILFIWIVVFLSPKGADVAVFGAIIITFATKILISVLYPYVDENVHDIKQFGMTMEFVLLLSGALVSSPNTQDIVSGTAIYSVFSTTNNSSVTGTVLTVLVILTFVTYGILFGLTVCGKNKCGCRSNSNYNKLSNNISTISSNKVTPSNKVVPLNSTSPKGKTPNKRTMASLRATMQNKSAADKAASKFMSKLNQRKDRHLATAEIEKAEVYKFFTNAGLRSFHPDFVSEGFSTMQDIINMDDEDIKHVGVVKRGDLKKLRVAIEKLEQKKKEQEQEQKQKRKPNMSLRRRFSIHAKKAVTHDKVDKAKEAHFKSIASLHAKTNKRAEASKNRTKSRLAKRKKKATKNNHVARIMMHTIVPHGILSTVHHDVVASNDEVIPLLEASKKKVVDITVKDTSKVNKDEEEKKKLFPMLLRNQGRNHKMWITTIR